MYGCSLILHKSCFQQEKKETCDTHTKRMQTTQMSARSLVSKCSSVCALLWERIFVEPRYCKWQYPLVKCLFFMIENHHCITDCQNEEACTHLENNDKVVFQNLVHFHFHFKKYEMLVPQLQSRHQFVYSFMGCAVFMFRDPFQMSSLQTNNELSMDRSLPFTYMASTFRIWRKW